MGFALKLRGRRQGRDRQEGRGGGAHPRPRAAPRPQAGAAVRRPAPARGDGARDRARPGGVPDGRAALEPRRQAARADAHRGVAASRSSLGTTTIYVTHDQTEAMTLGDRVAVMRAGRLQQVGSPMELYNHPLNLFVAGFIGSPAMNFMPATVEGDTVKLPIGDVRLPQEVRERVGDVRRQAADRRHPAGELRGRRRWSATTRSTAARPSGRTSRCSSRWARSCTRTSRWTSDQQIESQELRELAEDAGARRGAERGRGGPIVARLDPREQVRGGRRRRSSGWTPTRLHLFDPERRAQPDGRSRRPGCHGRAATASQGG